MKILNGLQQRDTISYCHTPDRIFAEWSNNGKDSLIKSVSYNLPSNLCSSNLFALDTEHNYSEKVMKIHTGVALDIRG